jgi:hypothetical protein
MGVRTRDSTPSATPRIGPRGAEAETVVQRWNDQLALGRDMLWSPTIRAALLASAPWLDVFCPGCGTSSAIDLRTLDRHPLALGGSWCPGSAPMPKLIGLFALPPVRRDFANPA